MINIQNLSTALPWLMKDEHTFNNLKDNFPEILADLTTFKNNPNCSCRGRVIKFFMDKLQENSTLLNSYIYNETELKDELDKAEITRKENNYSGKIITIPKNEISWNNLAQEINKGKLFRGFSVVEKENEIVIYFL